MHYVKYVYICAYPGKVKDARVVHSKDVVGDDVCFNGLREEIGFKGGR